MLERAPGVPSTQAASGPGPQRAGQNSARSAPPATTFEEVLRQQRLRQPAQPVPGESPLVFSKHAQQRFEKREIQLDPAQSRRLQEAVHSAASRGARQSLVVLDGMAFVVNVQSRTVVTALNPGGNGAAVFTNIDSAVVA